MDEKTSPQYKNIPEQLAAGQTLEVRVPGSCGELTQGLVDEAYFLITCPIGSYSRAILRPTKAPTVLGGPKTQQAVAKTLLFLGEKQLPGELEICSQLPVGEGMSSSSADIGAACQAVALAFGRVLAPQEILTLATGVEPTDGVFCPGVAQIDHVTGAAFCSLGEPPAIMVSVWDQGGQVDTQRFNERQELHCFNRAKERVVRQAVQCIKRGMKEQEAFWLGHGAMLSARANQILLPKLELELLWSLALQQGAIGVNVAHSGTVLGVLWKGDVASETIETLQKRVEQELPQLSFLGSWPLVSGGSWYRCGKEGEEHDWVRCF